MVWRRAEAKELRCFLEDHADVVSGTRAFSDRARFHLDEASSAHRPVVAFLWFPVQGATRPTCALVGTGHQETELVAISLQDLRECVAALDALFSAEDIQTVSLWVRGYDLEQLPDSWRLERSVEFQTCTAYDIEVPAPNKPYSWRTFVVGEDEDDWLVANTDAFRNHPDQGQLTFSELVAREREPWFSPEGFLLAIDGVIAGFCWTKLTAAAAVAECAEQNDAFDASTGISRTVCDGEIYAIGVIKSAQGNGLGRSLVTTGLSSLWQRGAKRWSLYVESDNQPAQALYNDLGFQTKSVQRKYRITR